MLELLAPAGSMDAVTAAVQNGAGAVYFGYGNFNARRNAKNFSFEEAAAAVSYCHLRGCKVHLTLNTLLTDKELHEAAELAAHASDIGIDAVIVQDLGVMRMLQSTVPDLPLHASTQMTIHTLDGVKQCADLGFSRVVLSRELSRKQIAYICEHSPIEIEVFGHGALCMCYSGQCYVSSVIGGRSGNRGLCAQPCRLQYGWQGRADEYPLSLKDMSLAGYLNELQEMGVACLKLEGRMKRAEYVAIVTRIYADALRERREPTPRELQQLEQAFSRQGFTQGYYLDEKTADMFGTRQAEQVPQQLFAAARATYETGEHRTAPIKMLAQIQRGQAASLRVQDDAGHVATVYGAIPEPARTLHLSKEKVAQQLLRTGGTPFHCEAVEVLLDEGLSLPLSALNALRRDALEQLAQQRTAVPTRRKFSFSPNIAVRNSKNPPEIVVSLRTLDQLTKELLARKPALLYLPAHELARAPEQLQMCKDAGIDVAAALPRIYHDEQAQALQADLLKLQRLGITQVLAGNMGSVQQAQALGFVVRGDFGLGVYNSQTVQQLAQLQLISATASFELKFAQIRDLSKELPLEILAYGCLPLMIFEHCIINHHFGDHGCESTRTLTDRKGVKFPVLKAYGCRNELLNSTPLYLADKCGDYKRIGLWAIRLQFTTETPAQCVEILNAYQSGQAAPPQDYTRGLYYREVQ